jgi:hypothetical protein
MSANYPHPNAGSGNQLQHPGMGMPLSQVQPNAGFPHGWQNQVNHRPYTPIVAKTYANYGVQPQAAVTGTDYARQAAERLIGPDGRLDRSQIPHMLNQLNNDRTLSLHHRSQMIKTLQQLERDQKLAFTINSICERPDKPLHGPAADLVRATLNLPPAHERLGPADARKAAVMAILGNLRQGNVGSCFATGPGICVHEDSPGEVANNLKELLEKNCITLRANGSLVQVPLNRRISRGEAQIPLSLGSDGTCYGKASEAGRSTAMPYKLHRSPGMQGALTALGIPEHQMEQAVAGALWQMGHAGHSMHTVTSQRIIETLARHPPPGSFPGNTSANQRIASALNAFAGKEDVRLLRAWEYTLATHAESANNNQAVGNIGMAVLYGNPIPGRPDLQSLAGRNGAFQQQLRSNPYFGGTDVGTLSQELFNDVDTLMRKRFFLQYDANVANKGISADGVSNRGGFVLYDRVPPDDPSRWQRIDNPQMFQAAMAHLVEEASHTTYSRTYGLPGQVPDALRAITDNLKQNIGINAFTEQAATSFSMLKGKPPSIDPYDLPWQQAKGSLEGPIIEHYGGRTVHAVTFPATTSSQTRGDSSVVSGGHAGDATHIVKFVCEGMAKMVPELHAKAQAVQSHNFKIPISSASHAFTFMPMQMGEVWLNSRASPEQWIDNALKRPALKHLEATRTGPPLVGVLQSLCAQIGATPQEFQYMYRQVSGGRLHNGHEPYSLDRIHQELRAFSLSRPNSAQVLEAAENALMNAAPIPARIFADTNWVDNAGNPIFIGAQYNPFKDRIELQKMDKDQGNRQPLGEGWLSGHWDISTPLASHAAAPAA